MAPPEVILDRYIKAKANRHPSLANYLGRLDIEQVQPPSFRAILRFVRDAINEALRLETVNASGGVAHPPFYFDYVEVKDGKAILNAHAFQHGGFSFIVATLPLVELLWDLSHRLSRSPFVQQLLRIDPATVRLDGFQALLFQLQLSFLVSHEYTHHVHQHCEQGDGGIAEVWTEFSQSEAGGSIDAQVQELDADGYAIYLGLTHYLRGVGRRSTLALLGREDLAGLAAEESLLVCFLLALISFFCALWPDNLEITSIRQLTHPPAPVRIEYAKRIAKMLCDQNESTAVSWLDDERFQVLFRAALEAFGGTSRQSWDAQIAFLQSEEGTKYDRHLSDRFNRIRGKVDERAPEAAASRA